MKRGHRAPWGRRIAAWLLPALAATLATPGTAQEEPPDLEWTVRPVRAEIGDLVRVDLEVVVPPGLAIGVPLFPSWTESWGDTEVVSVDAPAAEPADGGATRFRQTITITPWATGELTLPSPVVEIPTASEILKISATRPIVLTVGSVLPQGEEQPSPKPPAPPLALPVSEIFWWTLGLTAAACLLAGALLFLRRRAAETVSSPVAVDPLTAFRQALVDLDGREDSLALISGLSLALRRYLGGRLDFRAAESTTTEIRRRLQERGLPPGLVLGIDRLLRHCDAVKFARRPIERAACSGPMREATGIADRLEAHLAPPPQEATAPEKGREAA